jgi:hypothetical protein
MMTDDYDTVMPFSLVHVSMVPELMAKEAGGDIEAKRKMLAIGETIQRMKAGGPPCECGVCKRPQGPGANWAKVFALILHRQEGKPKILIMAMCAECEGRYPCEDDMTNAVVRAVRDFWPDFRLLQPPSEPGRA